MSENKQTTNNYINPHLLDFIATILKSWKQILLVGFIAGIIGFVFAYFQKPQYESRLTFSLDAGTMDGSLSGAMSLAAQFGLGFGSGQNMFDGDNILEIIKSRRIIEKVLLSDATFDNKKTTLLNYYLTNSGKKKQLQSKSHLSKIDFEKGFIPGKLTYWEDSILNNAYLDFSNDFISASRPDKKLGIYEIKVKSGNEQFTKIFTDRLIEFTTSFYTEITSKKDRETLEILEARVASLKSNVGSSIDIRATSEDANKNPAFSAAQSPALKQQYNMQAYGEAYKEMFKTLEMARYQYLKKIPLLQVIDDANYPMKRIKLSKLKAAIMAAILGGFFCIFLIWVRSVFKIQPTSAG
jgi:hypothetical protein